MMVVSYILLCWELGERSIGFVAVRVVLVTHDLFSARAGVRARGVSWFSSRDTHRTRHRTPGHLALAPGPVRSDLLQKTKNPFQCGAKIHWFGPVGSSCLVCGFRPVRWFCRLVRCGPVFYSVGPVRSFAASRRAGQVPQPGLSLIYKDTHRTWPRTTRYRTNQG